MSPKITGTPIRYPARNLYNSDPIPPIRPPNPYPPRPQAPQTGPWIDKDTGAPL